MAWFQANSVYIGFGLWVISEILAASPLKSNSVVELFTSIVKSVWPDKPQLPGT